MILLDSSVIAEMAKEHPDPAVAAFMATLAPGDVCTAVICEAEIHYGLVRLPAGKRRDQLTQRMTGFVEAMFKGQVFAFDRLCVSHYADIRSQREAAGRPISVSDAMIAATARAYSADAIATRNVRDFGGCGVEIVDPWRPAL
jgi:toxin FitB